MKVYDLAIAYRVYPKVSRPALNLPFGDDKYLLVEACFRSFQLSLGDVRAKYWVLLDGCPDIYEEIFRDRIPASDLVVARLPGVGNRATFARQIEILLQQEDASLVYFAEDDYFYLPGQFPLMLDFIRDSGDVDFVSPYDHLDCYKLDLHRTPSWIRPHGNRHWRTAASTCLTFLTHKKTLASCEPTLRTFVRGNDDCALWLSLTKERIFNPWPFARYLVQNQFYWKILVKAWLYCPWQILFGHQWKLWVPVPGIATHLDKDALSPTVDWIGLMSNESVKVPRTA